MSWEEPMLDVAGTALRVLESCSEPAGERGIELRLVVGKLPPVAISHDAFSSALRNLLRLAIGSTQDGPVKVQIRSDVSGIEVRVASSGATDCVRFPMAHVELFANPVSVAS